MSAAEMAEGLAAHGLLLRGGLAFDTGEGAPEGPGDIPACSVLLVGQAGGAAWLHFLGWKRSQPATLANPLDSWSREVIGAVADKAGARAVFPSDRPYLPFQRWAMRAEGLRPSPLGILMHPEYGLWHAYRGALLFDVPVDLPDAQKPIHLCDACVGKPCLNACPVDAYSAAGFAYDRCLGHVRGETGGACRHGGCLDRNACPYGADYRYPPDMQAFHMAAFSR
ncbi:MAG: 4Fe-4S dicluster domain-containing protein [Rhizobiaceae bacterium]|nr:4Fe-4S dicluster domain-containing protein [Rhizobiaceae bacterium]